MEASETCDLSKRTSRSQFAVKSLCVGFVNIYVPLKKMYEYSGGKTVEESQSSPTQLLWQLKEGR